MKKVAPYIVSAIVVIAIIVVIIVFATRKSSAPAVASNDKQVTDQAAAPAVPGAADAGNAPKIGAITTQSPQIHFVSQSANASSTAGEATKHGIFLMQFSINAADHTMTISQACHAANTSSGFSFSLLDNGTATTDGIGNQSCLVTSVSNAGISADGKSFMINPYTAATFQIAVAAHPANNGSYKIQLNRVGYTTSAASGTKSVSIDASTKATLQTNSISL